MRRRSLVVFAIVASILAATMPATVVATHSGGVVVSTHTTDTDFNSATLTNMTVEGSGSSATVELVSPNTLDDFEDGDIAEYVGDTGSFTVQQSTVIEGEDTLRGIGNPATITSTSGLGYYPSSGENFTGKVRLTSTENRGEISFGVQDADNRYTLIFHADNGELRLTKVQSGTGTTLDSTPISYGSHLNENLTVSVSWDNSGEITATLEAEDGTELGTVQATDTTWSSGGIGYVANSIGADDPVYFDAEISKKTPAEYLNNHSATNTVGGFANITTADNVSITATWRGDSNGDGSYDTLLNQTTGITSAANHSFTWSEFSGDDVQVNVAVESTGSDEAFVLESEGVEATNRQPSINNSSATPTGTLQTASPTLEIDVADPDFSTPQGDNVTVTFYSNQSGQTNHGTDTLTSNGTASTTADFDGGMWRWWVVAEDEAGHTVRSANFTVNTPGELSIYNETAVRENGTLSDSELVKDVEVEIRMYQENGDVTILTKKSSTGVVDMTGLDPDTPFVVVAQADGYVNRRIFVGSLFEAQEIFLLPENETHVVIEFELRDFSGAFPQEDSVLKIQRGLNGSWRTVEGDFFGATGEFSATLRYDARHQLVIKNVETGEERDDLGVFQPVSSEDKLIQITESGDIEFVELDPIVSFEPGVDSLPATSTDLSVTVENRSTDLVEYNVTVIHRNASGNTTLATFSGSDAAGETFETTLDLTNATGNVTVEVEWSTSLGSGSTTEVFGIHEYFANDNSLLAVLGDVETNLPTSSSGMFMTLVAVLTSVMAMLIAASNWPVSPEEAGIIGLLGLAFWAVVGWLGWPVVLASSLAWVGAVALTRRI